VKNQDKFIVLRTNVKKIEDKYLLSLIDPRDGIVLYTELNG